MAGVVILERKLFCALVRKRSGIGEENVVIGAHGVSLERLASISGASRLVPFELDRYFPFAAMERKSE